MKQLHAIKPNITSGNCQELITEWGYIQISIFQSNAKDIKNISEKTSMKLLS